MAEVIRRALDTYLASEFPNPQLALTQTFGALPDSSVPDRGEWARD
jgi:hypothetical protein